MSDLLGWQFSVGFVVGVATGVFLCIRAIRLGPPRGYRGVTRGTGRIVPPQGGSGTAKATFSEPFGRAVAAMHPDLCRPR